MWKLYKEPNYDEKNNSSIDKVASISEYSKIAMLENKIKALESELNKHVASVIQSFELL